MKKIIIILMLLTACAGFKTETPEIPELYTGTDALTIKFHPGSSKEIFVETQADITVEIENKGAHDIKEGKYVWIYEEQYWTYLKDGVPYGGAALPSDFFALKGKSKYRIVGDRDQFELKLKSNPFPTQLETYTTPIIFQACYPYKTFASAQICIDPDIQNLVKDKVCSPEPVSFTGGQGGPIGITRVEPIMRLEGEDVSPTIMIYIKNLGRGTAISNKMIEEACGEQILTEPFAKEGFGVMEAEVKLGDERLDCIPKDIRLKPTEETRLVCRSKQKFGAARGTFTSFITVQLDYGYMEAASHPIFIKKLG